MISAMPSISEMMACALRRAGFEKLLDAGQTGGDIQTDHAAGMEGAQGELGAGLADALGGDDADGGVHVDELAAGQVAPVAVLADALARLRRSAASGRGPA